MTAIVKRHGSKIRWGEYGPCLDVPEFVLAPREIDFEQSVRSRARTYVGACVDVKREDGTYEFAELDRHKRLIYCSLGTYSGAYKHSRQLFMAVINALREREDLAGIIQVGNALDIADIGELPTRIRVVKDVPQLEVLRCADVFITHGGFSSTREACYFAVPMIVFPCWLDQPGNAARIVHHGIGVRGNITRVEKETILSLLSEIDESRYKTAMKRMQRAFREQESCKVGVDFVLGYLGIDGHRQSSESEDTVHHCPGSGLNGPNGLN